MMKLTVTVLVTITGFGLVNLVRWHTSGDDWYAFLFLINIVTIGLLIYSVRLELARRRFLARVRIAQAELRKAIEEYEKEKGPD